MFNLARIHLTNSELALLSKGLKFCPIPGPPKMSENEESIRDLIRKIHINAILKDSGADAEPPLERKTPDAEFLNLHKTKSGWNPKRADVPDDILAFTDELAEQLRKAPINHKGERTNLKKREQIALRKLKRKQVIIKPADKGSGIVIMTVEQYKTEVLRQLKNGAHYRKIENDQTPYVAHQIQEVVKKYVSRGRMDPKVLQKIIPNPYRPAKFYILPKIHKSLTNPPGRPIMSANGHPTEFLSQYIDIHLKRHVQEIPSYIKDTNHLLEMLGKLSVPKDSKLVTFDVSSLYTNIPQNEAIEAVREFMSEKTDPQTAEMLSELTKLVLEGNVFEFGPDFYIQTHGTAMGTRMAPNLSNIFMHLFESKNIPHAPVKPLLWKRYIDDIIAIFTCSTEDLKTFENWLNSLHPTIKFTMNTNPNGIEFLDTFIQVKNGKFHIRPFTKPTDTKQYVEPTSCHPPHTISAIPYSQALRLKRICTEQEDLEKELVKLYGYFRNRNYSESTIVEGIQKALYQKPKPPKETAIPTTMVIEYNPRNPNYSNIINHLWNKHKEKLSGKQGKPLVSYKRPKNLREILTKAKFTEEGKTNENHSHARVVPLQNRPFSTYDREQMKAKINYLVIRCQQDHRLITEEFDTLQDAEKSVFNSNKKHPFVISHEKCGNISVIPIKATALITVKCTDCNYNYRFHTHRKTKDVDQELKYCSHSMQKGLYREEFKLQGTCLRSNCQCCKQAYKHPILKSPNGINYRFTRFNCAAKNAIYMIICRKCGMYYIGMTSKKVRERLNQHRAAVRAKKATSVSQHFTGDNHSEQDMQFALLEHQISAHKKVLQVKEATWIHLFDATASGMNRKEESDFRLDPNTLQIIKHFQHSITSTPYITSIVEEVSQNQLKYAKRPKM